VVIDLAGSGLEYKPGDALGVYPENYPELVDETLKALGAGDRLDLRSALCCDRSLGRPSDDLIERLVECATDPDEADLLTRIRDGEDDWIYTADLLEVLRRHPSARMEADGLVPMLGPLQPGLYSISSSLRAHPEQVHLTVGAVKYTKGERLRKGVASTFLAERLAAGGEVWVFVHVYEDDLRKFQESQVLTRLDLAFSRNQAEKVYVQDRMLERARELWDWLEDGAHFYVCGDANPMASDVDRALQQVIATQGNLTSDAAKAYVANMSRTGRYQRDVY
jgi:sulfite reductase (NADPH) flavoprotein alpha-component